ncbi:hypothetical protein ABZ891_32065 [Streptomyces sp. NPDC047023]|uniref:hypothetical protein n=1 Tax=Streptomyces sp. NPDC047023 TaxID=3155139 RepID=UPI003410F355
MFEITAEFAAGKTKADPQTALRLSYLASRVTASDGHQAAVLLAPQGEAAASPQKGQSAGAEGWQLAGIRDGDTDISLAERGTQQERVFNEPQINAWYRLTSSGMVEPLNEEAKSGFSGKSSIALDAYQKLVSDRYGDKLPGSEYDRNGMAGGYAHLDQDDQSQVNTAVDAPAAEGSWQTVGAGGAAVLALGGGAVAYARRRRVPAGG